MFPRDLGVAALAFVFAASTACVVQGGVSDPQPFANGDQSPMGGLPTPSGTDFRVIVDGMTPNVYAGMRVNFKVIVENIGPEEGLGVVQITLDPALEFDSWTCVTLDPNGCPDTHSSDPATLASLEVELPGITGHTEFVIDAWVDSGATAPFTVAAHVSAEDDGDATNNDDSLTHDVLQSVLLKVTKSDGLDTAPGGSTLPYEIRVENWGPSDAPAVTVADAVPTEPFVLIEWTCTGVDGAECGTEGGAGDIADVGSIPAYGALVYTLHGHLNPCFTGTVTNEAHATTANLDTESVLSATDTTDVPDVGDECAPDPCECECDDGHDHGHNGEGHNGNGNGPGPGHSDHDDDGDGDDDHRGNGHHSDECDCDCDDDDGDHDDDDDDHDDDDHDDDDDDHHGDCDDHDDDDE